MNKMRKLFSLIICLVLHQKRHQKRIIKCNLWLSTVLHVFSVGGVIRPSFNLLKYLRSIVFSFMNDFFIKPYHFVQIFNLAKHLIAKYGLRVTTTEVQNFQKAVLVGKCLSL